jgi:hypothetical protein
MCTTGILPRLLFALGLELATLSTLAPTQSVGQLISYQKTKHGIEGRTGDASFAVSVYSGQVTQWEEPRYIR